MKKITLDTINEFAEKIEAAKVNMIPMLPFVKLPLHDFDRYKYYSEKGIYLIDYIDKEYCLYHLYHLTEGDDTLRATLILPSNWDRRFDIIERSIPNLKEWFLKEDHSEKFMIQSLEYGEIEYFPTLSHYMIPTIIRNGFKPIYRMYMKREVNLPVNQVGSLVEGLCEKKYEKEMLGDIVDFYFHNENVKNNQYFTNCTQDELLELFVQDFTIKNSRFITNGDGRIISGIIISKDAGKVWIDNFTVSPEFDDNKTGEYILYKALYDLAETCPNEPVYIYLNRDCKNEVMACGDNGFVPFEFWTDMILEK